MTSKNIIQRNLPLDVKYSLIDKKYISIEDGGGWCCDNCGRLIANMATVSNEDGKQYIIGFDCLETFLINNMLLDGKDVSEYQRYKKQLPTFIKKAKELKEYIKNNNANPNNAFLVSIEFDVTNFLHWAQYGKSGFLTSHYISNVGKRFNDYIRLKNDVNPLEFIEVLKSILKIPIQVV